MFPHGRKQIICSQVISPASILVHPQFENCCVSKSQSDFYHRLLTTVRMDFEYSQVLANRRGPALSTFFEDRVNETEVLANTCYLPLVGVRTKDFRNEESV